MTGDKYINELWEQYKFFEKMNNFRDRQDLYKKGLDILETQEREKGIKNLGEKVK